VDPPIVEKISANANAIIFMVIRSYQHNIMEVNALMENVIKRGYKLFRVSGTLRSLEKRVFHALMAGSI